MSKRFVGVDLAKGKDVSIVTVVKGSDGLVTLEDVRREVLGSLSCEEQQRLALELVRESVQVPADLRVSCPFGGSMGACKSPSKRKKAWVCGSNFSHNERMDCCIFYRRLDSGLRDGVSGNRRFRK